MVSSFSASCAKNKHEAFPILITEVLFAIGGWSGGKFGVSNCEKLHNLLTSNPSKS